MPEAYPSAAEPGGNSLGFATSILEFAETGLAVAPRGDLGAVEIKVRAGQQNPVAILLGPSQGMAVAALLIAAVATVGREREH